jgi:hypothetical protein
MSPHGDSPTLLVQARSALLDALEALSEHRDAVIVIGAQAIYLHTGNALVALAEATKDSDLAVDPRRLDDDPLLEEAMTRAGFYLNPFSAQPGAWMNAAGIPVDLMVPEALAGTGTKNTRGARIPPHDKSATRRARGLEAAVIDNSFMTISALDASDSRRYSARVAGPAALLVAKIHKIAERADTPHRLNDKDAHDIYRLLVAIDTVSIAATLNMLMGDPVSGPATGYALEQLEVLFAAGPESLGSVMAGRAEEGIGDPVTVALAVSLLAADIVTEIRMNPASDES